MENEPLQVTPSWGNDKWSDPDAGSQRKAECDFSPGDIANSLLHAADDHPCCKSTFHAAANLLANYDAVRACLEYIAHAGISARHCEDEARKALALFFPPNEIAQTNRPHHPDCICCACEERDRAMAADCCDSLTASEWLRLSAWFAAKLKDQQVKPAIIEFTCGACRDAASAFEQAFRHNAERIQPHTQNDEPTMTL